MSNVRTHGFVACGLVGPHLRGGRYLGELYSALRCPFSAGGSEIRPYRMRFRRGSVGPHLRGGRYLGGSSVPL